MTREEVVSLKDGDIVQGNVPGKMNQRLIIRRPILIQQRQSDGGATYIECELEHPGGGIGNAQGGISDDRGWLRWDSTVVVKPMSVCKGFKRISK